MFDPHQISARLAVVAGVALLAALIVPSAFAVEPMIEAATSPARASPRRRRSVRRATRQSWSMPRPAASTGAPLSCSC